MNSFDSQIFKVALIGDVEVGKTSILHQLDQHIFSTEYVPTVGGTITRKKFNIDDKIIEFSVWDISGHENFRNLTPIYCRGADCCILVYDIANQQSFENIEGWKNEIITHNDLYNLDNFPFLLLGNKSDLPEKVVQESTAREYASKNGNMLFYEVSAKTGKNIQEAFESLAKKAFEKGKQKNVNSSNHDKIEKNKISRDRQMLKLLLLGDMKVGKTSIRNQFVDREFTMQYKATIGSDFSSKQLDIEGVFYTLQIWDTAGQERFQSLGPTFYRGTDCCILVYDVTNQQSFEHIKKWKNEFSIQLGLFKDDNFPFMLLGNKSDLPEKVVQESTAREYASKNGNMLFYEVSSKTGKNFQEAFEAAVKNTIKHLHIDDLKIPPSVLQLETNSKQESKPKSFFQKLFSKKTAKIEPNDDTDTDPKLQSEICKQKKELEMQLANKNKEIESLKEKHESKIKELEMQLANKNKEIESLKEKHKSKIKELEVQFVDKNKEIESKNDDLKKMQNQIDSMKQEHDEEIQLIKERNKKDQKELPPSNPRYKSIDILDFDSINELEKIDKIGYGSSGEIYKVAKKEIYALKVMKIAGKNFEEFQQFINEYEIMNILNHLNILKTYGIFLSNETTPPSFLLEFCPMNLDKAIKTKTFTNCQIVFTIYQIAEGMRYVHFQKVIHRDLKPTNILVAADGTIKISDFGISKLMSAEEQSMTKGLGTQKFMAPEIINEEDYDEKVDVYSFGVIVYFIISGEEMPNNKIRDICLGKKADIPSSFTQFAKDLINECWEFDPKKRPSFNKICDEIEKNKFNLLDLKEIEIKEVEIMVNKLKDKIPPY